MTRSWNRPSTASRGAVVAPWFWYAAALAGHTGWGIYPVLGRYLQTVAGVPSMSVLVLGGIPMTILFFAYVLPRYGWRIYAVPMLWAFGAVTVMRSITNILSQRFTLAIYVQLVGLLTPFLVVMLNWLSLREKPPLPIKRHKHFVKECLSQGSVNHRSTPSYLRMGEQLLTHPT